jgi:hypothetical protein
MGRYFNAAIKGRYDCRVTPPPMAGWLTLPGRFIPAASSISTPAAPRYPDGPREPFVRFMAARLPAVRSSRGRCAVTLVSFRPAGFLLTRSTSTPEQACHHSMRMHDTKRDAPEWSEEHIRLRTFVYEPCRNRVGDKMRIWEED